MERALYIQPIAVSTSPIQCASAGLPFVRRRCVACRIGKRNMELEITVQVWAPSLAGTQTTIGIPAGFQFHAYHTISEVHEISITAKNM